jgi:hypothetical protein
MLGRGADMSADASAIARVVATKSRSDVTDDFEREVDEWFHKLEEQLAPAGRVAAASPDSESPPGPERPVASNPSTIAPHRSGAPGLRRTSQPDRPEPEPVHEVSGLARREPQAVEHTPELVRTEALVDVMKELASEIKSVRRDVDQIKKIISRLRQLAEAKRRGTGFVGHESNDSPERIVSPSARAGSEAPR